MGLCSYLYITGISGHDCKEAMNLKLMRFQGKFDDSIKDWKDQHRQQATSGPNKCEMPTSCPTRHCLMIDWEQRVKNGETTNHGGT